jgi:hypothetical protein
MVASYYLPITNMSHTKFCSKLLTTISLQYSQSYEGWIDVITPRYHEPTAMALHLISVYTGGESNSDSSTERGLLMFPERYLQSEALLLIMMMMTVHYFGSYSSKLMNSRLTYWN